MNTRRTSTIAILVMLLTVAGATVVAAGDKYTLQVPDGLAFSEFRGYESWQVVSVSHPTGAEAMAETDTLNVIVANQAMIDAYAAGIPGNGKPFPDGAKAAKIQYVPKRSTEAPFAVWIPDRLKDVAFMLKDSARFPQSGG